ncbi:MAG: cytochrome P450 [Porticoccaceae bacterium]
MDNKIKYAAGTLLAEPDNFAQGFPHELFAQLRRDMPVCWSEWSGGTGFWSLTKYEDVGFAGGHPEIFSSATENGGHRIFEEQDLGVAQSGANTENSVGIPFISRDPPLHINQRLPVMKSVTPDRLNDMKNRIRERIKALISAAKTRENIELVESLSAPIPIKTLTELLDMPESYEGKLFEWTNALIGEDDPDFRRSPEYMAKITQEIATYFGGLRAERMGSDRSDVVTVLSTDKNGDEVPFKDFIANIFLILVGGNETTRNSISGGIQAFSLFPQQWQTLKENPQLIPNAVNEIVRWVSPVMHMRRTLMEDVTIRGVELKKGDKILLWYPSANRDEDIWPNPDDFDVSRPIIKHRAFGAGTHLCVGSRLAELQIAIFLEEFLNHCDSFEVDGEISRIRSNFISGMKALPLRVKWKH